MDRYLVMSVDADSQHVALRDNSGRHHCARAVNDTPLPGTALVGSVPALGFRVLRCRATQREFRVIFEQVDCAPVTGPIT